jgi:hypothetical protein
MHDSRIVIPTTGGPMNWEVYSRDGKNTIRARSDIINVINAHPPARLRHVEMDPFFHQNLREKHAELVRNEYGVHILLPNETDDTPEVVLVYEGPSEDFELPRQRPSAADIAAFDQALRKAQEHVLSLANGQRIGSRDIEVPPKYVAIPLCANC